MSADHVYVLAVGSYGVLSGGARPVKIGHAMSPRTVVTSARRFSWLDPVSLVAAYPVADPAYRSERALHARLDACRLAGEWFALDEAGEADTVALLASWAIGPEWRYSTGAEHAPVHPDDIALTRRAIALRLETRHGEWGDTLQQLAAEQDVSPRTLHRWIRALAAQDGTRLPAVKPTRSGWG